MPIARFFIETVAIVSQNQGDLTKTAFEEYIYLSQACFATLLTG
jgi:hypothetical protein